MDDPINPSAGRCILLHTRDNTVTALSDLHSGEEIILESQTPAEHLRLRQAIPYAHKFARTHILQGADVIKYGEVIGMATSAIEPGDHVHVHNVDSKRARGDRP